MDFSMEYLVDGSDSYGKQADKVYPDKPGSLEASGPVVNGNSHELLGTTPHDQSCYSEISFESKLRKDDSCNEQSRRNFEDEVFPVQSQKEIDVNCNMQHPSQERHNANEDTSHAPQDQNKQVLVGSGKELSLHETESSQNGTSVRSANEISCDGVHFSDFKCDKKSTAEGLSKVLPASDLLETAEIKSEQEQSSRDSQVPIPVVDQSLSPSNLHMLNDLSNGDTSRKGSPKAEIIEPLEKNSAKNVQKSSDERLKLRTELAPQSSMRGAKLFADKPSRHTSEASRADERPSKTIQSENVERKHAKRSPDKPPKISLPKPSKPVANGSNLHKGLVPKTMVTDDVCPTQPDKPITASIEKAAKHRPSPIKNRQNGNIDLRMGDEKSKGSSRSPHTSDKDSRSGLASPTVNPFIFKLVKSCKGFSDSPFKALDYALHSVKFYERKDSDESHRLDLVMSLHVLAVVYCRLGQYEEAIAVIERSLALSSSSSDVEYGRASYSGYMQLGDTLALLGRHEASVDAYRAALMVQKEALGELDLRVGDTWRYLAEAHLQAMQLNEAEMACQQLLRIHADCSSPGSIEEAADRRLMALICSEKGDHEKALEYLVLASMALISDGQNVEAAFVQSSIGDTYVSLGRYEDAVFAYQKALTVFKSVKSENHPSVASVYVSLAELYVKTGRQREAKIYCESALRIYKKHDVSHYTDEVASGLTAIACIYEALNDPEQALNLLQNTLDLVQDSPGQQCAIAGIQAQIGVLHFLRGKPAEAFMAFKNAVILLKSATKKRTSLLGILLNQMGLACVELYEMVDAAELFEEAKSILEETCGPDHPNTLSICGNLAGAYDALGRLDDAIQLSKSVLKAKEDHFGREHPEVQDETVKLKQLQNEVNLPRLWKRKHGRMMMSQFD